MTSVKILFKSFDRHLQNQGNLRERLNMYLPEFYKNNCDVMIAQNCFDYNDTQDANVGDISGIFYPSYILNINGDGETPKGNVGYIPTFAANTVCYLKDGSSNNPNGIHQIMIPSNGTFGMNNFQWYPLTIEPTGTPAGVKSGLHICNTVYGFMLGHYCQYGPNPITPGADVINPQNIQIIIRQMKTFANGKPFILFMNTYLTNAVNINNLILNEGVFYYKAQGLLDTASLNFQGPISNITLTSNLYILTSGVQLNSIQNIGPFDVSQAPDNTTIYNNESCGYIVELANYQRQNNISQYGDIGVAKNNLVNINNLVIIDQLKKANP